MIYVDFVGKTPVNTPKNAHFPSWKPWTKQNWDKWLAKSRQYLEKITLLNNQGKIKDRNNFIDRKKHHWAKLKPWLEVLSYGKCWFSEVRELYSHYEVEHFRPKKECRNIDGSSRDGYWWLAFDYTNFRLCGNMGNRKKGGWFPLKEGSLCSTHYNRCEESETNYLLDPTDPCDPELIAFDEEGKAIPSPLCKTAWDRKRAEVTIERLKLSESERLTEERKKIWLKVNMEIEQYYTAKSKLSEGCNPAIKEKVKIHLRNIKKLNEPTEELSAVVKWCLYIRDDKDLLRLVS